MNLYGEEIGSEAIVISEKDRGRVDWSNWGSPLILTDDRVKIGTVMFGRVLFGPESLTIEVDKADPTKFKATFKVVTFRKKSEAEISEGGSLIFTFKKVTSKECPRCGHVHYLPGTYCNDCNDKRRKLAKTVKRKKDGEKG